MSNSYRLNVRFDLDDADDRTVADYLNSLGKAQAKSRFLIEAAVYYLKSKDGNRDFTLDDIRQVVREELSEVSCVQPVSSEYETADTELTEEQKAENEASVLSDLDAFF